MKSILSGSSLFFLLTFPLFSSEIEVQYSKKYQSDAEASMMSFLLINHSRLIHEIESGKGDYVESLLTQKNNPTMNINLLKTLSQLHQDTYSFAKVVTEYH